MGLPALLWVRFRPPLSTFVRRSRESGHSTPRCPWGEQTARKAEPGWRSPPKVGGSPFGVLLGTHLKNCTLPKITPTLGILWELEGVEHPRKNLENQGLKATISLNQRHT